MESNGIQWNPMESCLAQLTKKKVEFSQES